jgi:hypothetical protein
VTDGALDSLILPHVNGACMQLFLDEVCARHPDDRLVMVLDGARWRQSASLRLAHNLRLLTLPPHSPELNPVEHLWDDLREKSFHDRVFDSIDALEHHLCDSLRDLELDHQRVRSIVAWPWIFNSLLNLKGNKTLTQVASWSARGPQGNALRRPSLSPRSARYGVVAGLGAFEQPTEIFPEHSKRLRLHHHGAAQTRFIGRCGVPPDFAWPNRASLSRGGRPPRGSRKGRRAAPTRRG